MGRAAPPGAAAAVPEVDRGALARSARAVWRELPAGSVVWLSGPLGAGKTAFVQALVAEAGGAAARSPTFALVHEYDTGEGPIAHVDCYRLRAPAEAVDLDLWELARRSRLLVVEWPERGGSAVPPPDVHLSFQHTTHPDRRMVERLH